MLKIIQKKRGRKFQPLFGYNRLKYFYYFWFKAA